MSTGAGWALFKFMHSSLKILQLAISVPHILGLFSPSLTNKASNVVTPLVLSDGKNLGFRVQTQTRNPGNGIVHVRGDHTVLRARGGKSESSLLIYGKQKLVKAWTLFKAAIRNIGIIFLSMSTVSLTLFFYLNIVAYVLSILDDVGDYGPSTIASLSLTGSILASLAGGACVGYLAASRATIFAGFIGTIFSLFQVRQLALFQGMPSWFFPASVCAYVPCCVLAARLVASRRASRRERIMHEEAPIAAPVPDGDTTVATTADSADAAAVGDVAAPAAEAAPAVGGGADATVAPAPSGGSVSPGNIG